MNRLISAIRAYAAADDPLVGAANTVALVLAGNQPFYPLYLIALFGSVAVPSLVQIAITPLFAIVPWLNRRAPVAGRVLLVLVGSANTVIYIKLVGRDAGLELFFLPCMMLAGLIFRQSERGIMLALMLLPPMLYFVLGPYYGASWIDFPPGAYPTMLTMNAVSVATLAGFFGILSSGIIAAFESRRQVRPDAGCSRA